MAEAPKAKPAASVAAPKDGAKKEPNPLVPVIAIVLFLLGAFLLVYNIMTEPPPKKEKHGGH